MSESSRIQGLRHPRQLLDPLMTRSFLADDDRNGAAGCVGENPASPGNWTGSLRVQSRYNSGFPAILRCQLELEPGLPIPYLRR